MTAASRHYRCVRLRWTLSQHDHLPLPTWLQQYAHGVLYRSFNCLALALCLLCTSVSALARSHESGALRVLLEHEAGHVEGDGHDHDDHDDHDGHVEPAANEGQDGNLEGHGEGMEDHAGHVPPSPTEGDDGELEGHGEGAEMGEGADGEFEGTQEGGEGLDGEFEGGTEGAVNSTAVPAADEGDDGQLEGQGEGETVAEEASAAWSATPVAVAMAAACALAAL